MFPMLIWSNLLVQAQKPEKSPHPFNLTQIIQRGFEPQSGKIFDLQIDSEGTVSANAGDRIFLSRTNPPRAAWVDSPVPGRLQFGGKQKFRNNKFWYYQNGVVFEYDPWLRRWIKVFETQYCCSGYEITPEEELILVDPRPKIGTQCGASIEITGQYDEGKSKSKAVAIFKKGQTEPLELIDYPEETWKTWSLFSRVDGYKYVSSNGEQVFLYSDNTGHAALFNVKSKTLTRIDPPWNAYRYDSMVKALQEKRRSWTNAWGVSVERNNSLMAPFIQPLSSGDFMLIGVEKYYDENLINNEIQRVEILTNNPQICFPESRMLEPGESLVGYRIDVVERKAKELFRMAAPGGTLKTYIWDEKKHEAISFTEWSTNLQSAAQIYLNELAQKNKKIILGPSPNKSEDQVDKLPAEKTP